MTSIRGNDARVTCDTLTCAAAQESRKRHRRVHRRRHPHWQPCQRALALGTAVCSASSPGPASQKNYGGGAEAVGAKDNGRVRVRRARCVTRTCDKVLLTTAPPTIDPRMMSGASGPASRISNDVIGGAACSDESSLAHQQTCQL